MNKTPATKPSEKEIEGWNLIFVCWILATVATLGSLFFSEVMGLKPCVLCWYQRIFMYPLVITLGMAYFMKKRDYITPSLVIVIIGFLISIYHNVNIIINTASVCTIGETSCFTSFFTDLGYINIPMMALTGFIMVIIFSIIALKK